MIVFRATPAQIEALNIEDFFTGHNLGLDIHGMHYYGCDRYCEKFPWITEEIKEDDSEEIKVAKTTFKSLEQVEYHQLELPELD